MKFIASVLLTSLLAFAAGLYLPWWSIAIAAYLVSLAIPQRALLAFLSGFLGIFLHWLVVALLRSSENQGILGKKVAAMFFLGESIPALLLIGALIGGLVGGFSALSAAYLRIPKSSDAVEV